MWEVWVWACVCTCVCVCVCACLLVCVSLRQKSRETSKGSRVVRVMWSRCLSDLSLSLFLVHFLQELLSCCQGLCYGLLVRCRPIRCLSLVVNNIKFFMHFKRVIFPIITSLLDLGLVFVCLSVYNLQPQCQCTWPCWVAFGKPPNKAVQHRHQAVFSWPVFFLFISACTHLQSPHLQKTLGYQATDYIVVPFGVIA